MSPVPSIKLNSGHLMPAIGLGTWSGTTPEEHDSAKPWIISALKNGYRHLDTAHGYGTEHVVGDAVRASGVPREEIFVTTKLPSHHHASVEASLDESLQRMGFDYVDLYLIHWPQTFPSGNADPVNPDGSYTALAHPDVCETWASMEKLLTTGKVRSIGVSNFSVKTLTQLLATAKVVPAVNQIEMHPHLNQNELLEFSRSKGITLTAYSPTGYAPVRNDPAVISIAKKHNVSPAQVSLAWHVARGTTACPKSTNSERQIQNLNPPTLDEEDMKILGGLNNGVHLCGYPGPKGQVFGWTYEELGW